MKRTHLIAVLVGVVALGILAADASAMYNPNLGQFMQRDPGAGSANRVGTAGPAVAGGFIPRDPTGTNQYADGMSLYQYVRSNPITGLDPQGLSVDDRKNAEIMFQVLASKGNQYETTLNFMTDALRIYDDLISGKVTKVSRNQDFAPNSWLSKKIATDKDYLKIKSNFETILSSRVKSTASTMRLGETKTVSYRVPKETNWGLQAPTDNTWMDAYHWFHFSSSEDLKAAIAQAYASGGASCSLTVRVASDPTSKTRGKCQVDYKCNPGFIWVEDDYDFVLGGAGYVGTKAGVANDTMAVLQNEVKLDKFFHWKAYIEWHPSGSELITKD